MAGADAFDVVPHMKKVLGPSRAYGASFGAVPADFRRFVILTTGRTGSELLVSLLDAHPNISCDAEILSERRRWPDRLLKGRARLAQSRGALAYGFKAQPQHLDHVQRLGDASAWLRSLCDQGWMCIHLRRRNILHQAISVVRAHTEARWHFRYGEATEPRSVAMDPLMVVQVMYAIEQAERRINDQFKEVVPLELTYEDDLETLAFQQATLDRLTTHLGVPRTVASTSLVRTNPTDISETVSNFGEVLAEVRTNRFSEFADE